MSKYGKFEKENKSMTPVLERNTAGCGRKLPRISERFSESSYRQTCIKRVSNSSVYTEATVFGLFSSFLVIFIHCWLTFFN